MDHPAHSARGKMIEGLAHYGSATSDGSFIKAIFEKI
jgi:hypothetical protein